MRFIHPYVIIERLENRFDGWQWQHRPKALACGVSVSLYFDSTPKAHTFSIAIAILCFWSWAELCGFPASTEYCRPYCQCTRVSDTGWGSTGIVAVLDWTNSTMLHRPPQVHSIAPLGQCGYGRKGQVARMARTVLHSQGRCCRFFSITVPHSISEVSAQHRPGIT